ncbi:MAG: 3-octaprenyl-4-hydroxybenzoate carboxy-lyase partner protein [Syntrophorhabdus sp. PtaU1.Bin153]|nr:MAG: 3-octaprenyl-4-hydroxybenzoate carboxy-lyase partner protein [Syntrophorhabdus sp. PtaU1.Bin153]
MIRIIVGISGATGVTCGIRLLEVLKEVGVETHLILTESAKKNILIETDETVEYVEQLAHTNHDANNLAASIASGSFRTDGMVVVPCTIKTLSGIANSYNDTLLVRAADVMLKEKRRLILVVRETPFHKGHLRLMHDVADLGAVILPPVPAFYHAPRTIQDLIDHITGKILDLMDIEHNLFQRWGDGTTQDPNRRRQTEEHNLQSAKKRYIMAE